MSIFHLFATVEPTAQFVPNIIVKRDPKPGKIVAPVAPGEDRPYRFTALDAIGVNAVEFERFTFSDAPSLDAWLSLTDPDARRVALAHLVDSKVATIATDKTGAIRTMSALQPPTESQLSTVCDLFTNGWNGLDAIMQAGFMIVPSDAAAKSAATKSGPRSQTPAEKRAVVIADVAARFAAIRAARAVTDAAITATVAGTAADDTAPAIKTGKKA